MTAQLNNQQTETVKGVFQFAITRGYDMNNLTPEMLEEIMGEWVRVQRTFHKCVSEAPISAIKQSLRL